MTSKLDKHADLIITKLNNLASYSSISQDLMDAGCRTSASNIWSWIHNRAKKNQARQALVLVDLQQQEPESINRARYEAHFAGSQSKRTDFVIPNFYRGI